MREILGDDYQALKVEKIVFEEDIAAEKSRIRAEVAPVDQPDGGETTKVEGEGVGLVDAFFHGVFSQLSSDCPSLKTLRFVGFSITGMLDPDRPRSLTGTDAIGEARLVVENSDRRAFEFVASSKSITAAALQATLDAAEYFVNSERAFMATWRALKDAESRGRSDLVQSFNLKLAELVRNTSYSESIAAESKDG